MPKEMTVKVSTIIGVCMLAIAILAVCVTVALAAVKYIMSQSDSLSEHNGRIERLEEKCEGIKELREEVSVIGKDMIRVKTILENRFGKSVPPVGHYAVEKQDKEVGSETSNSNDMRVADIAGDGMQ